MDTNDTIPHPADRTGRTARRPADRTRRNLGCVA